MSISGRIEELEAEVELLRGLLTVSRETLIRVKDYFYHNVNSANDIYIYIAVEATLTQLEKQDAG